MNDVRRVSFAESMRERVVHTRGIWRGGVIRAMVLEMSGCGGLALL